jgi:putative transposase
MPDQSPWNSAEQKSPQATSGLTVTPSRCTPLHNNRDGVVAPSASTISRLNQSLTQQFDRWRERHLQEHWRILYFDGVHFNIRHGDKADSTIILTVLGVDLEGTKEVLALRACAEESKEGWLSLLQDLRTRGATQIDVIVTDGHEGLLAAVPELFSATPRQRCLLHTQPNVLNAVPRRERGDVQVELVGIWEQPSKQEAVVQLEASTRQIWQTLSGKRCEAWWKRKSRP